MSTAVSLNFAHIYSEDETALVGKQRSKVDLGRYHFVGLVYL